MAAEKSAPRLALRLWRLNTSGLSTGGTEALDIHISKGSMHSPSA